MSAKEEFKILYKVNKTLFSKIFRENNGNCLCKLNTKCPCSNFLDNLDCKCGVFVCEDE